MEYNKNAIEEEIEENKNAVEREKQQQERKNYIEECIQEIEDTITSLNNLFDRGIIKKDAYFKTWDELEICRQDYLKQLDNIKKKEVE